MYEYVALEWRTGDPKQDTTFRDERREMLDRGWTEYLRAGWPQERMPRRLAGGICIMRRRKGGDMYEYVAVKWSTMAWCDDRGFASAYARLRERGWEEHRRVQFERYVGGACIMRRPQREARCEGRLWTKAEIKEIAGSVYIGFDMEKARDCRPVLNERVKQADDGVKPQAGECLAEPRNEWPCERVADLKENFQVVANITEAAQTRVAELQTAIDEVVCVANQGGEYKAVLTLQVVRRLLNPLATKKEESNG